MARTKAVMTGWPNPTLDDDWRNYAALHGVDAEVEFESFRDHHLAKGSKFADWFAAWRTWVRNAERFKNEKRAPIGFTAPPRLSMQTQQAIRDNEEIAVEVASMTPEQRRAAVAKLQGIISGFEHLGSATRQWRNTIKEFADIFERRFPDFIRADFERACGDLSANHSA